MPTPADDHVVVRGGLLENTDRLLEQAADDRGRLSVIIGPELSRELCVDGGLRNGRVRTSTVAALQEAGFELEHDPPPDCHYNIAVGTLTPATIERLKTLFEEPIPNPGRGG